MFEPYSRDEGLGKPFLVYRILRLGFDFLMWKTTYRGARKWIPYYSYNGLFSNPKCQYMLLQYYVSTWRNVNEFYVVMARLGMPQDTGPTKSHSSRGH